MCGGSPAGLSQTGLVRGQNYRAWNDRTHCATLGWAPHQEGYCLLCQRSLHPFHRSLSDLDYLPRRTVSKASFQSQAGAFSSP